MRRVDVETLDALGGSRPADTLTVWAWRSGKRVVLDPLLVKDWSFEDQAGDSVKVGQKVTLTVADPDGNLGAWRFDDPLGVGGTRLQIIYNVGGSGAINYGWFRITGNQPTEFWDSRVVDEYGYMEPDGSLPVHKRRKFIKTAAVQITAVDLTGDVDRDKLQAPESPPASASVVSEFKRFTARYFPTVVDAGVVDTGVSRQLVYNKERLESCQDLLTRISARYRMGGDGEAHIYPLHGASVLRIEPNAGLVSVSRNQSIDGLYNRWVVEGKNAASGDPIFGVADIENGPLKYGGPHGRVPYSYSSEMITTVAQATTYAQSLRDTFIGNLAVQLTVETIPRPELQAGDWVEVGCPVTAGHVVYLPGAITDVKRAGDTVPRGTSLTVSCSYTDVIAALDRTEWAKYLTSQMPDLTWDLMPATWGSIPAINWSNV